MNKNSLVSFEKVIEPRIYHHYTSLDALYNIITTKTFRMTCLKSSNDRKELFYSIDMFRKDVNKIFENETNINLIHNLALINKSIDENYERFKKLINENTMPYALCLSEKKDNLTHWDRYANNCKGVCIAFNTSSLYILMMRYFAEIYGTKCYDVGKILYKSQDIKTAIKREIVEAFDIYEKITLHDGVDVDKKLIELSFIIISGIYKSISKFIKNDSFIDEDEIRIYHDDSSIKGVSNFFNAFDKILVKDYQHEKNVNKFIDSLDIRDVKFYYTEKGIRSYKNLCLKDVWGSGTIPEIIIGPMCMQNIEELKLFLKANGLSGTKVSTSKVPIR